MSADAVARALSRLRDDPALPRRPLDLGRPHRYVILSDQHKGARDAADAFRQCEDTYRDALTHYRDRDFTLVLLGDVEELWEQGFDEVARAYPAILALEASFGPDRYVRIVGNHDDDWMDPRRVADRLAPFLPVAEVHEGLRFDVAADGTALGTVLLVHGHQGTLFSHRWRWLSRVVLRVWRPIQRLFGIRIRTPSTDPCLRGDHDRDLYAWAAGQPRTVLVAGHTHRPVWSSRTHLQKLEAELAAERARTSPDDPAGQTRLADLADRVADRRRKHPPCHDTEKTMPAYFNTGCCIFDDGDITAIELEDGVLRLVRWAPGSPAGRTVFEEEHLRALFGRLA